MKNTKLSNTILFTNLLLSFIFISNLTFSQTTKEVDNRPQIVLNVTSDNSKISIIFEFTKIINGKKIKTERCKTPFRKTFVQRDMIFLLKKISGKSNINYSVTTLDKFKIERGNVSSTAQNVKVNFSGEFVNIIKLE